jgi:hypothetical protein
MWRGVIIESCLAEITFVRIFSEKTSKGDEKSIVSPSLSGKHTEIFDINAVACSSVKTLRLSPLK